jgi:hypothetical protein
MTQSSGKQGRVTDHATIVQNQHLAVLAGVLGLEHYVHQGQDLCHDLEVSGARPQTILPLFRTSTWPCWLLCWGWSTICSMRMVMTSATIQSSGKGGQATDHAAIVQKAPGCAGWRAGAGALYALCALSGSLSQIRAQVSREGSQTVFSLCRTSTWPCWGWSTTCYACIGKTFATTQGPGKRSQVTDHAAIFAEPASGCTGWCSGLERFRYILSV